MLGQLKSAKQGYKAGMDQSSDLAQATGLTKNVRSPGYLKDVINSTKSEDLQSKLLPLDDVRAQKTLFDYSPETAGLLRTARIKDLAEQSGARGGKEVVPSRLLNNASKLNPETIQMLFGKNKQSLEDLGTVLSNAPEKTGPSGTPQGLEYLHMMNPLMQGRDLLRYMAYKDAQKNLTSGLLTNKGPLATGLIGQERK